MCTEATRLMSTLQMSAIPSSSTETSPFKEFTKGSMNPYPLVLNMHPFESPDVKGSLDRFSTRYVSKNDSLKYENITFIYEEH